MTSAAHSYHLRKLQEWITEEDRAQWQNRLAWDPVYLRLAAAASAIAGLIMAIGTVYLLMEALVAIPVLAAIIPLAYLPSMVLPLSAIAGIAYGLLTYNTFNQMIMERTLQTHWEKLTNAWSQDLGTKEKSLLIITGCLFILSTLLTLCTAGTWSTVFGQNNPLLTWLFIPNFILNIIFPIYLGMCALVFSLANISNTLDGFNDPPTFSFEGQSINHWVAGFLGITVEAFQDETWVQKLNLCRIILRSTFEPLRIILFIGHLLSIGATTDRLDGITEGIRGTVSGMPAANDFVARVISILAMTLSTILELFEDWDYFFGHQHAATPSVKSLLESRFNPDGEHNHDNNLPILFLKMIFYPLLYAAALWSYYGAHPDKQGKFQDHLDQLQGLKPTSTFDMPAYVEKEPQPLFFEACLSEENNATSFGCC